MEWIGENCMAIVFLITTILAVIKAILLLLGKKKAALAVGEIKKILHQTFGNVELLKKQWKDAGLEEKYGHIGEIFGKINKEAALGEIMEVAYKQWMAEQDTKTIK